MTPPQPLPIVYFHPVYGWYSGSGPLTEREAEHLCREENIPYSIPADAPDRYDPVLMVAVTGTWYVPDIENILSGLVVGQILGMSREDNPHDSNAIMVVDRLSRKVGYIPRNSNQVLASLMDIGEVFVAKVLRVDADASELEVMVCMRRGKCTRRHFSVSYDGIAGPIIQMDNVPVTMKLFKYKPMSRNRREIIYRRNFTSDELWDMRWGHLSESMDDRWNIVYTHRGLYFCRSWSGHCMFRLVLGDNGEHKLFIENDRSFCNLTDESALEEIDKILNFWFEPVPIPKNQIPNGVFGNFKELPPVGRETRYSINADGTVTISVQG